MQKNTDRIYKKTLNEVVIEGTADRVVKSWPFLLWDQEQVKEFHFIQHNIGSLIQSN